MEDELKPPGRKPILTDRNADSSNPRLPAFLARPTGAPVYHGFPIIEETETDGWRLGSITVYARPGGCREGDAFVVAPDGTRAGIVWSVGTFETTEVCKPSPERWGVYSIAFPHAVTNDAELTACFRAVLPELKRIHAKLRSDAG